MEIPKTTVTTVFTAIKTGITSPLNSAKSTVTSVFSGIQSTITNKINSAKSSVSSAINAIKGFFNFKFKWPSMPLPHFGISPSGWKVGDLLKGSIPSLSIKWYKEGGILDGAQIFGAQNGGLLGGGEAGKEAVLPLDLLWKEMRSIFSDAVSAIANSSGLAVIAEHLEAMETGSRVGSIQELADRLAKPRDDDEPPPGDNEHYQITYSPTFQFYGEAPTKEDLTEAARMSQSEFNDMMDEWFKPRTRLQFA